MDTNNPTLESLLEESIKLQGEGYPTVPRTIEVVKEVTLFCKYKDPEAQKLAGSDNEIELLRAFREGKDYGTMLDKM